jgi:hypothetical protein
MKTSILFIFDISDMTRLCVTGEIRTKTEGSTAAAILTAIPPHMRMIDGSAAGI